MFYQLIPAHCPRCIGENEVQANVAMTRDDLVAALDSDAEVLLTHAFPLASDHKFLANKEQKDILRKRIAIGVI
jgi:hypothetical protein